MRQGIGALTGANTQTTKEKVEERLAQLDINKPNDQEEILKLVSVVNPQGAAQFKAQFAQQGRVRATEGEAKTSGTSATCSVCGLLGKNVYRPELASQTSRVAASNTYSAEGGGKLIS